MTECTNEEKVLGVFEKLRRAMLANDPEPMRALVADDYRGSDAGGRMHDREAYLEAYGPGGVELDAFEVDELETVAWSDAVLVRGTAEIQGRYGPHEFEHRLRFLDVYGQRDAGWRLLASHVCDIATD